MKIQHKILNIEGTLDESFTQAQYEKYQELLLAKAEEHKTNAAFERILVEAAVEAEILKDLTADLTRPACIKWLTLKIKKTIEDAITIPPE